MGICSLMGARTNRRVIGWGAVGCLLLGCSASGGAGDADPLTGGGARTGNEGGSSGSEGGGGGSENSGGAGSGSGGGGNVGGPVGSLGDADTLCTFLLIGPSDAAGYNAQNRNSPGGHGFARLLVDNNPAYPDWGGKHLSALWPGVRFVDQAESGFTTEDMLDKLERRIGDVDRGDSGCDTWVHIGSPGNDFNDDMLTIISRAESAKVSQQVRQNLAAMSNLVRQRFHDPSDGRTLLLSFSTIQDPTDGTGRVPPQFTDGFCEQIHTPAFTDELRAIAIENIGTFNQAVADEAAVQGAHVVDQHAALFGHGMPASDRWLAEDCTHPNNAGHHAIRANAWGVITGTGGP